MFLTLVPRVLSKHRWSLGCYLSITHTFCVPTYQLRLMVIQSYPCPHVIWSVLPWMVTLTVCWRRRPIYICKICSLLIDWLKQSVTHQVHTMQLIDESNLTIMNVLVLIDRFKMSLVIVDTHQKPPPSDPVSTQSHGAKATALILSKSRMRIISRYIVFIYYFHNNIIIQITMCNVYLIVCIARKCIMFIVYLFIQYNK